MATSVPENDIFSVTEVRTGFLNTDTDSLDQHAHQFSVSPNAPYTNGPPSPPLIPVPVPGRGRESRPFVELVPKSTNLANTPGLRCVHEIAHEGSEDWNYEQRWTAQPIVDGLYLGPTNVVRDHDYLHSNGITMVVVVCSNWVKNTRLKSVTMAEEFLRLDTEYIALENDAQIIHDLQKVFGVFAAHGKRLEHLGKQSKILVTCETGNDRSAAVVAAFIMALYGETMITVLQFMSLKRFCISFSEDTKRMLLAWQDIVAASSSLQQHNSSLVDGPSVPLQPTDLPARKRSRERSPDIEMGTDDDSERFVGREDFVPFIDNN